VNIRKQKSEIVVVCMLHFLVVDVFVFSSLYVIALKLRILKTPEMNKKTE